jgi:hypothetical protein
VYDVGADEAWMSVGTDHDTAAFAVESIRRQWTTMGGPLYPDATRLLVTADCGGSNGYRTRLWKRELPQLADETDLAICVFPPGTSKWNKVGTASSPMHSTDDECQEGRSGDVLPHDLGLRSRLRG